MTTLAKPLAVLFDWDGTIVDSSSSIMAAHNHVRRAMGKNNFTVDEFIQAARIGNARETFTVLYPTQVQEAIDLYYGVVPELRSNNLQFIHQAEIFIKNLHDVGVPMGVVSNMRHGPLMDEINRLGWNQYFRVIVGAGEAARGKPAPDPVYLAAERMGYTRAQLHDIWFIGDMETDEKAAKAAGCPFLYYMGGISDEKERGTMRAAHKFADYGELWRDISPLFPEVRN